jgi:hypothetical protein
MKFGTAAVAFDVAFDFGSVLAVVAAGSVSSNRAAVDVGFAFDSAFVAAHFSAPSALRHGTMAA